MYLVRVTVLFVFIGLFVVVSARAERAFGPIYNESPLVLAPGKRVEVLGPLLYWEEKDSQRQFALPPLFSRTLDPDVESEEIDVLYPILSYDRYGAEYRVQLLQLFSFAGGATQEDEQKGRFTLFPFYFQQRSANPEFNYTAVFPLAGTLRNRLFRDEIRFVMFPLYAKSWKKDVVTENYLFPIVHFRTGDGLSGWQVWPLAGSEHKDVTSRTNSLDEEEVVGGHDKRFALWPIFFKTKTGIGTENPEEQISMLPLFTSMHSPQRDSSTAPWPLGLTVTEDRARQYREIGAPWPFIVYAYGEGKNTKRVWPLFSRSSSTNQESNFYLWPIYKYNRFYSPPLDRTRTRILFFLYSDILEKNLDTSNALHRVDFWPFFTFRRDHSGNQRLQVLAPLEPILPNNKSIERDYSPLWSLWRAEKNPATQASSQSLLWNLYRRDTTATTKKCSLIFGLFQYESDGEATRFRWFHAPSKAERRQADSLTQEEIRMYDLIAQPGFPK